MEELTLATPVDVPKDLSHPGPTYRRHVWLAVAALLAFVAVYLTLTAWFVWSAYHLLHGAFTGSADGFEGAVIGLPMAFLAVFMLKALFFRIKRDHARDFEITAEQEPRLFGFLARIADAAGAPRPHRVFLSPQVNAGVFYDLSILNLIVPSRKNLDIGLGLINSLSLGEVQAVLAHEFGHFGQRAMAVGRWVYVAQRIASHIVNKRDALDRFLMGISNIDLRVAWIGWLMRIVVWSLRSVLDTAFSLVVLADRALSREMEMQADLVAVSLTGSDALIHALHKLGAADAAWDQALSVAATQYQDGKAVPDIFALQQRAIDRARGVLADPHYGVAPPLPVNARAEHRVFEQRMAHPPRMWSTHPPNREREDNAKRCYVACDLDERAAWLLFRDPPALRAQMTQFFLGLLKQPKDLPELQNVDESMRSVDQQFDRIFLDPSYRGAYLRRSVVRSSRGVNELYLPSERHAEAQLSAAYPEQLRHALERWKSLESERDMLVGLQRGVLQAGAGNLMFRGAPLRVRDLSPTLERVASECATARTELEDFDRRHRTAHRLAAEQLGQGWPEYLRSLLALLHYADHTEANLRDAAGHLQNVFSVVTADGRVSKRERKRLVLAAHEVYEAMREAFESRQQVRLPVAVAEALELTSWAAALPEYFQLGLPDPDNIGKWLEAVDSWLDGFIPAFDVLERASLEALLKTEARVAALAQGGATVEPAPGPAGVPAKYARLLPGSERERQWRLGLWDRFQLADGLGPSLARFAVAGSCVAATVAAGAVVGDASVIVYNGLARPVVVHVGEQQSELQPATTWSLGHVKGRRLPVRAETVTGTTIERFDAELASFSRYVYNVAGAAPLVRWTAVYGNAQKQPNRNLGAPYWTTTDADILFEDPPTSVSTKKTGGTTREVLSSAGDAEPAAALSLMADRAAIDRLISVHAQWDESSRPHSAEWLAFATRLPNFEQLLAQRLKQEPRDVLGLRLEQDNARGTAQHEHVCARQRELARGSNDPDLRYLVIRCEPGGAQQDLEFLQAHEADPDHPWLAFAAGYVQARKAQWPAAITALRTATRYPGMPDDVSIDFARLLRVARPDFSSELDKLAARLPQLKIRLGLEVPGEERPTSAIPYGHLARGDLATALTASAGDPRVLRLVAASKGATTEQIEAALVLGADQGIDRHTIWSALGLLLARGKDAHEFIARLKDFVPDDELPTVQGLLDPEQLAKTARSAGQEGLLLDPVTRGHVYALACSVLGERAPEKWLTEARELLFADERPYL